MDSTKHAGGGSNGDRDDDCDWFHVYRIGDGGAAVLRLGVVVALPFCLGLFSVLVHSYHEPRSFGSCMSVALGPIALLGTVLILVMIEGLICILMAAPFALGLAAFGSGCWGTRFKPGIG